MSATDVTMRPVALMSAPTEAEKSNLQRRHVAF